MVIGIQLAIVGIQLPQKYPWHELKSLAILLLPVMTCMWLVTTGLTMLCFPNVPLLVALVIASCATPTDPVLSNSIVKGSFADQHVSPRLRNIISAESGANDGFGYPFLFLAVYLLKEGSTGEAIKTWVFKTILYQVLGASILGFLIGLSAKYILRWSTNRNFIDKESFLCYGIAVGIFTVGSAGYLDVDDLLAAFVAGNALTWDDWYREETEEDELQNVIDLLLNTVYFIFVGATIPWESFHSPEDGITVLKLAGLGILVLLLRRLPALLAFHRVIPCLQKSWSEAAFMGYFGPIGAGAIFYSSLVMDQFEDEGEAGTGPTTQIRTLVKPITYALVLSSVLGHTLMIPVLKWFLSWRNIGNIQLRGEEGEHQDHESDAASFYGEGDADRREADYEAGETREDGHRVSFSEQEASSVMSNAPNAEPASVKQGGAYHWDGRWDPHASWRISSSHRLPSSSGHKLGTHFAAEQHRQSGPPNLPGSWSNRIRDLERNSSSSSNRNSQANGPPLRRPSIEDHRRQSVA